MVKASPIFKTGKTEIESLLFHGTKRTCLLGEDPKNIRDEKMFGVFYYPDIF